MTVTKRDAPFSIQHRVQWGDVDMARVIYFPRYFDYFAMAELEWFRSMGLRYEAMLETFGVWMPRVASHADFLAPARLADLLSIELYLKRLGRTSFTFGFDAYRLPDGTKLAEGYITIATVSRTRFRPVRVPRKLVQLLGELKVPGTRDASPARAEKAGRKK